MILTVTLNAAIDRTMAVPNFHQGHRHRAVETSNAAGGKGVNVARALSLLGRPVIASGLAGGPTGERFLAQLAEEAVLCDFVRIAAETRTNLAVIDPTSGEQTEINERGPDVTDAEVEAFVQRLAYLARGVEVCVLAGSLPPGVDPNLYARLVRDLRSRGVVVVLDAEGESMRAGLRAGPSIVTPNLLEAEEMIGHEFEGPADLALGLSELLDMGAEEAVITRPDGCVAAVADESGDILYLEVTTPELESVAAVGSGDALVAGYVAARYEKQPAEECLAYGVACGAESTQHFGAGAVDRENVERIRSRVEVRRLEVPAEVG